MIGKTILHYKIIEQLGAGGMGVVYKAEDTKLQRTVALKFLPDDIIRDEESKEKFIREARSVSKLDHQNICHIHAVEETEDGKLFISMAYYDGNTLQDIIDQGPMEIEEALTITNHIAAGLIEAHSKGIIHRDIKPSNIMLTDGNKVKIMDFGLAKSLVRSKASKAGTAVAGTIGFMSPEQSRGEEVDSRTDIWSLGVVLYYMLTGQLPFKGGNEPAIIYSILYSGPEPISGLRTGVPVELESYIGKCLEKDRENRYPTVNDLIVDLRRLKKDATERETLTSKYNKLAIGIAALVIIAVVSRVLNLMPGDAPVLVENRVAVAFFENETGDEAFDYLERMIAGNLTTDLAGIQNTEIAPLFSEEEYGGKIDFERLRELSNKTNAQIIVSGEIYKQGNNLLIQSRVTDIATGETVIGLPELTGPEDDPSLVMESLRNKVMSVVYIKNSSLYSDYYRYMDYLPKYKAIVEMDAGIKLFREREYIKSIEFLDRAMDIDTGFVSPLSTIAVAYGYAGIYTAADSVLNLAEAKREQFSSYDRQRFGRYRARLHGDLSRSLTMLREMTELNPYYLNFYNLGLAAEAVNNLNEAEDAFSRIDKNSEYAEAWEPFWTNYGGIFHKLDRYEEELILALEEKDIFTESSLGLKQELIARIGLGQIDQVKVLIDGFFMLSGNPGINIRNMAEELYAHGYPAEARKINDMAIEWYNSRPEEEFRFLRGDFFDATSFSLFVLGDDDQIQKDPEQENITGIIGQSRDVQIEDLHRIINDLESEYPDDPATKSRKGQLAAHTGDRETALQMYEWLESVNEQFSLGSNKRRQAMIAAALGERSRAVTLLQDAFRIGAAYTINYHNYYSYFPLHGFPDFEEFMTPKR